MLDDFSSKKDRGKSEFFANTGLYALVLALLLVVLMAASSTHEDGEPLSRNRFRGGAMRPALHVECTVPEFGSTTSAELAMQRALFAGSPYVAVHLFSPALAAMATDVREGGTVLTGEDRTLAQQQDLSLYQFMQLAPGIDPGFFEADGLKTALLIPSFVEKQMVYDPHTADGYRVDADRKLAKHLIESVWPIYKNPILPACRPEEYCQARTRIYVETRTVERGAGEAHYVVIGHLSYKLPEALDDGSLAWLGGLSAGLTEIVFLGETWSDPEKRMNKRIEFMRSNGYAACANAYADYAFPRHKNAEVEALYDRLVKTGYRRNDIERQAFNALAQIKASEALLDGSLAAHAAGLFPPLLAYPAAWEAYITHCEQEQPDPPMWFYREFLDRLGFDRVVNEGSAY